MSRCGCGTDVRGDGKLDAGWRAPAALTRTPSTKGDSLFRRSPSKQLPGTLPPAEALREVEVRTLAARILSDAKNGRTSSINELLESAKLDQEQTVALLEAQDQSAGNTPLMLAAKNGHTETCQLLIARGAVWMGSEPAPAFSHRAWHPLAGAGPNLMLAERLRHKSPTPDSHRPGGDAVGRVAQHGDEGPAHGGADGEGRATGRAHGVT